MKPGRRHQGCCPRPEALCRGIMWPCPLPFSSPFSLGWFMAGYKDEMWGPILRHHCGALLTASPLGNMPVTGQQASVLALTYFLSGR